MQLELCDVGSWMGAVASHLGCQGSNCLTLLAASTLPRVSDDTDPTEWRRWARLRVRLRIHAPPPPFTRSVLALRYGRGLSPATLQRLLDAAGHALGRVSV